MAPLAAQQVRKENQNRESSSVTSLNFTLRALSDVSCLNEFTNLEKLDLSCNDLSSLQALRSCVNLKWLSVSQNKLQSLSGIEDLLKLRVLNASKNMLKTMNEVGNLTSLGALILNDNNISSICNLDKLTCLNTLVLSRNPIYDIGRSLENTKSITKLSLSSCQIQDIGCSLMFCVKLKEARFAHNEIANLPDQLAKNTMLRLLDLGHNAISKMPDLKVLSTLKNLRNLNLQGNLISEKYVKNKLEKRVKKLVPSLQIFNAKPMGKSHEVNEIYDSSPSFPGKQGAHTEDGRKEVDDKGISFVANDRDHTKNVELETHKGAKRYKSKNDAKSCKGNASVIDDGDISSHSEVMENSTKKKKRKKEKVPAVCSVADTPFDSVEIESRKETKERNCKKSEGNGSKEFDDGKRSFMDIILSDDKSDDNVKNGPASKTVNDGYFLGGLVINPVKKKNKSNQVNSTDGGALGFLPPLSDIGMGGPSAWDD